MKWWCCLAIVSASAFAAAEDHRIVKGAPNADDQVFARQVIEATGVSSVVAQSKVVYLNRGGVTLDPGDNDSRTNKSTLAKQRTQIPAWNTSDATWQATVACMKELFAPFDVTI